MSTSLKLALHVMPSDATRVSAMQASGERLVAFGSKVWQILSYMGAARGRERVLDLARSTATTRPELSAALRRAANGNWS
nr:hypothetical protein [uncultured Roseateles sp.]